MSDPAGTHTSDEYRIENCDVDSLRGKTILVSSAGNVPQYGVSLRLLSRAGDESDTAFVVTTTESADETARCYESVRNGSSAPELRLVDTTSEQQYISSPYGEIPTVFTPSPSDYERLTLALSDLSNSSPPRDGARHFAVRSLSPLLATDNVPQVRDALQRVTGVASDRGLCLLGVRQNVLDPETLSTISTIADGMLWVSPRSEGRLELEYFDSTDRYF